MGTIITVGESRNTLYYTLWVRTEVSELAHHLKFTFKFKYFFLDDANTFNF